MPSYEKLSRPDSVVFEENEKSGSLNDLLSVMELPFNKRHRN